MARIYIDDGARVMAENLAYRMKWDKDTATGKLVRLYGDSQAVEAEQADVVDLCLWMGVAPEDGERLVQALVKARIVVQDVEGGLYRIRGNKAHIEKLRNLKGAAQENGKKGGRPPKKPDPKPSEETGFGSGSETGFGFPEEPDSVQEGNPSGNPPENPAVKASTVPCSTVPFGAAQLNTAQHTPSSAREAVAGMGGCVEAWVGTLRWHGTPRERLGPGEDATIARAIRAVGAEEVRLAIIGGRFEEGSENYEPANHCKLARYLDSDRIVEFADLGRKAQDTAWVEQWVVRREERRAAKASRGLKTAGDDLPTEAELKAARGAGGGA
jgi:hypothetical protein